MVLLFEKRADRVWRRPGIMIPMAREPQKGRHLSLEETPADFAEIEPLKGILAGRPARRSPGEAGSLEKEGRAVEAKGKPLEG